VYVYLKMRVCVCVFVCATVPWCVASLQC